MQAFAALHERLDTQTTAAAQCEALAQYFAQTSAADKAWAVYLLAGGPLRQIVATATLRAAACQAAQLPPWLLEMAYQATGDLAEAIAHVLPPSQEAAPLGLAQWLDSRLLPLRHEQAPLKTEALTRWWRELDAPERFVLNKLISGHWRTSVSPERVLQALADAAGVSAPLITHRLAAYLDPGHTPTPARLAALLSPSQEEGVAGARPYPFLKPQALPPAWAAEPERLAPLSQWQIEWQYEGLRTQLVKRGHILQLWSAEGALPSECYPSVLAQAQSLTDEAVLDGIIVGWHEGKPHPFCPSALQAATRRRSHPDEPKPTAVRFLAFDLLEHRGADLRHHPLHQRRSALDELKARWPELLVAPTLAASDGRELCRLHQNSHLLGAAGLLLKLRESRYDEAACSPWLQWPADLLSAKAVLVYGTLNPGRHNGAGQAYTLAVWNRSPHHAAEVQVALAGLERREAPAPDALQLIPVAKVAAPLPASMQLEIDSHFQAHTIARFGPVRSVQPALVFELAYEAVVSSKRHKSGLVLRSPQLLHRWSELDVAQIDTLSHLRAGLSTYGEE